MSGAMFAAVCDIGPTIMRHLINVGWRSYLDDESCVLHSIAECGGEFTDVGAGYVSLRTCRQINAL